MCKQSVFLAPVSNHNDDEYDHGRSYQFMQRLWSALIEYRTRIAGSASADGRPDDAALLHVLHALDYNEIRWVRLVDLELDPLAQLTFTAQTMYDAILLERESLSANYPEVKELDDEDDPFRGICAQSWSCAVTELNREQHSWQFLEQAVNELHLGIGDCNYLCRSLLDWFTMRLLRDLKVRAVREPHSGKDFTDEHHEHHVRAIASSFTDEASEAILKHAISVCRLLSTVYRYTPPDPNREPYTGMDYELKWLWLNTNDILKLHDNPTIENFCDGELQFNLLLAPSLERGFWNACWDQLRLADQQSELLQPSPSAPIDMEFLMVMTFEKLRYHNVVQNHQHFIHDLQCTLRLARRLRRYEISQFGGVLPQDENMRAIVRLLALICRYADAAGRSNRAWVHDSPEKRALQLMAFYQETEDAAPPVESLVRHVARVVRGDLDLVL
ncbi:hypothetical protein N0V86_006924 [Didymella sp. IMI 355093]|nr:hypothetical protein N0V86_006924 [Didymella sp. IMI 355093]